MKTYIYNITLCFGLWVLCNPLGAQQDPLYAAYMFNNLTYNPAYAGAQGHLSAGLLHRTQWWSIEGAPQTQSFFVHTPLKNERVGLGLNIVQDKIGVDNSFNVYFSYAYRIPVGKGKLAIGLQGGLHNWRTEFSKLNLNETVDDVFAEDQISRWLPNFGAGIYFSNDYWYIGVSVPRILEESLRQEFINGQRSLLYRHYYFGAGAAIPLDSKGNIVFKPSTLVKNTGLFGLSANSENELSIQAPTEVELDFSLLFFKKIWLGASARTALAALTNNQTAYESVNFWSAYFFPMGLRIGTAFDFPLSQLNQVSGGSFELFMGYEFNFKTKRMVTPRYF